MGKLSISVYLKGGYEDFHALGRRKNKPNSKPIYSYRVLRKESQGLRSAGSIHRVVIIQIVNNQ